MRFGLWKKLNLRSVSRPLATAAGASSKLKTGKPIRILGDDVAEPEDKLLLRDFAWVASAMNEIAEAAESTALSELATVTAERDACLALLRWANAGARDVYLADWSGADEFVAKCAGLDVARAASAVGPANALGLLKGKGDV